MSAQLRRLFEVIIQEAEHNPKLARQIADVLQSDAAEPASRPIETKPRARNRRARSVLDPIAVYGEGESVLRSRLGDLTLEQLKDIVAEHGMDQARLAMKWKSTGRLVELIVEKSRDRLKKGTAFRDE